MGLPYNKAGASDVAGSRWNKVGEWLADCGGGWTAGQEKRLVLMGNRLKEGWENWRN